MMNCKAIERMKQDFINYVQVGGTVPEAADNARLATIGRNKIYAPGLTMKEKKQIWNECGDFLCCLFPEYRDGKVSEDRHVELIEKLRDIVSERHRARLANSYFRFGTAQKYLNMALKYLWVHGRIQEPPHPTVDAIIAKEVKCHSYKWTISNDKDEYLDVIEKCRKESEDKGMSMVEWELLIWNKEMDKEAKKEHIHKNNIPICHP